MKNSFDYTTWARSIALEHPTGNFMAIQMTFWFWAFLIMTLVIHFSVQAFQHAFGVELPQYLMPELLMGVIGGTIYGMCLGFADQMMERYLVKSRSMGQLIVYQCVTYLLVLAAMMATMKFIVWEYLIVPIFFNGVSPMEDERAWLYYAMVVFVYTFPMSLVISFINQMNRKFGPGVLVPLLLGRYRTPREEERIFMFMDLESSTTHAERLGHINYSAMIRDSFRDISRLVPKHQAEIYQYVGDEIVLSWPVTEKTDHRHCIDFYFDSCLTFEERRAYYEEEYGVIPRFKAGLHQGIVTAVEVGEIKRDIAYHGDTLNTAARIQAKCGELKADLLLSDAIERRVMWPDHFKKKFVGEVILRGKQVTVGLFSVQLG